MLLIFFKIIFHLFPLNQPENEYYIISHKKIVVSKSTPIGQFECNYRIADQNDTLYYNQKGTASFFTLMVSKFDCGNFLLNKQFETTLKADQYPKIKVLVKNLFEKKDADLIADLTLEMAGKQNDINDIIFEKYTVNNEIFLKTEFSFLASKFDLQPPGVFGKILSGKDQINLSVYFKTE